MLFILLLTSLLGAAATAAVMLAAGFELATALVAAPFGGSTLALLTNAYLAHRRSTVSKVSTLPARHNSRA